MSGNFLRFIKGVKDPFKAQEGRWNFTRDTVAEKGLILCEETGPSTLEINSLLAFALLWWTCSLGRFGDTGSVHNRNKTGNFKLCT